MNYDASNFDDMPFGSTVISDSIDILAEYGETPVGYLDPTEIEMVMIAVLNMRTAYMCHIRGELFVTDEELQLVNEAMANINNMIPED